MVNQARDAYGSTTSAAGAAGRGTRPKSSPPTRDDIAAFVSAIGGDLNTLPYQIPYQGAAGQNDRPQKINVVQYGGIWGQCYQQVGIDMRYHLLEFQDDIFGDQNNRAFPDNWNIRIPPTGPNACKRFRDQIFSGDPQMTVEFPTLRASAKRSEMERAWTAYLQGEIQREEQTTEQSPLDTMKQFTVDYGYSARYDVLDLSRWPERPKKKRGESKDDFNARMGEYEADRRAISPFVVRTVHPLNVAWDLTTTPPQWAMVREPLFAWDAQKRFPNWRPGEVFMPQPGATPVIKVEWWTPDWYAVYLNGEPALSSKDGADDEGVKPNPYGHIPLVFAAGGSGEADVANRPEVLLQGLIRKMRDLLLDDAILYNLMGIYERRASFGPKVYVQGPDTDIDGERGNQIEQDLMAGPQVIARLPMSWKVGNIDPSQVPQAITQRYVQIRQDIEGATAYDVAAGASQSGPAYKMQLQLGQTQKRVSLDALHLEQALEQWGVNRLRALKHLDALAGEKVGANLAGPGQAPQWMDLDPATLPDHIVVKCNLTSDSETEKARKEQSGLALYDKGLVDDEGFWRDYMDDPDPAARVAAVMAKTVRDQVTLPALIQVAQEGLVPTLAAQMQKTMPGAQVAYSQDGVTWQNITPAGTGAQPGAPGAAPQGGPPQSAGGAPTQVTTGPQGMVLPGEPQNGALQQALNPPSPGQQQPGGFFPQLAQPVGV